MSLSHLTQTSLADETQQLPQLCDVTHDVTQRPAVSEMDARREVPVGDDDINNAESSPRGLTTVLVNK